MTHLMRYQQCPFAGYRTSDCDDYNNRSTGFLGIRVRTLLPRLLLGLFCLDLCQIVGVMRDAMRWRRGRREKSGQWVADERKRRCPF